MEKRDYKHGKFTLAQTDTEEAFTYEDYVEWCEENDRIPCGEDSGDFYAWREEEARTNWDADLMNIEYCKEYNVPCVVMGRLGLWWGQPEIQPERFDSVINAIEKCVDGGDIHNALVEWNDGVITVEAYHHDGCNTFTIKALSKKGQTGNAVKAEEYKSWYFKRLPYLYAIGV